LDAVVETRVKHLLTVLTVSFAVFGLIFYMVEGNGNRDLARERHNNEVVAYQDALRLYDTQLLQVGQCNARYESRQAARELFISQNNTVRQILNFISDADNGKNAALFLALFSQVDQQDGRIIAQYPVDETNTCPPLPTVPTPPGSLTADDCPEGCTPSTTTTSIP